ncbi:Acg family FMN-binding oxidoreductase [Capnocytophaga sp. G2]|uniref:Acg family FMN-binding oxidoreductase n=1 Tax=Capnocytophaga sp. G2 TaxID=3110695 RepID=UPI002B4766F7|nr:nitroreductase [Capnocytophaga sp. G2]MEB3005889.1 nitroreductase [Capnocytophaga sp. G2]
MNFKMLSITLMMALVALKGRAQDSDFMTLIKAATQAPSGHNSQPWWFETTTHSIVISPNLDKALPAVDSQHRELFISLGCALENLCTKATELHYQTEVILSEEGVITVGLHKSNTVVSDPLAAMIDKRQTNRSVYENRQIDPILLQRLIERVYQGQASTERQVKLYTFAKDTPPFETLTQAVLQGNTVQMGDPAFKSELLSWIRFNKKHAESTHDGLSYAVLGAPNLPRWVTEPIVKASLKAKTQNKTDLKKIQSSSHMVLLTTEKNDILTWIQIGRTLERFLLLLTQEGIAHAYLNQPCEVPEISATLRENLPIAHAYPQILLRLGYAQPMAYSKRKDIREVIKVKSEERRVWNL